jgi:hypothetical protein
MSRSRVPEPAGHPSDECETDVTTFVGSFDLAPDVTTEQH